MILNLIKLLAVSSNVIYLLRFGIIKWNTIIMIWLEYSKAGDRGQVWGWQVGLAPILQILPNTIALLFSNIRWNVCFVSFSILPLLQSHTPQYQIQFLLRWRGIDKILLWLAIILKVSVNILHGHSCDR